jgi:hypothetical protein
VEITENIKLSSNKYLSIKKKNVLLLNETHPGNGL